MPIVLTGMPNIQQIMEAQKQQQKQQTPTTKPVTSIGNLLTRAETLIKAGVPPGEAMIKASQMQTKQPVVSDNKTILPGQTPSTKKTTPTPPTPVETKQPKPEPKIWIDRPPPEPKKIDTTAVFDIKGKQMTWNEIIQQYPEAKYSTTAEGTPQVTIPGPTLYQTQIGGRTITGPKAFIENIAKNPAVQRMNENYLKTRLTREYLKTGEIPEEYKKQIESNIPSEYTELFSASPLLKHQYEDVSYEKFLGFDKKNLKVEGLTFAEKKQNLQNYFQDVYRGVQELKISQQPVETPKTPEQTISERQSSMPGWARDTMNVLGNVFSTPVRMVQGLAGDISTAIRGEEPQSQLMTAIDESSFVKTNSKGEIVGTQNIQSPTRSVAEWQLGLEEEKNPVMKWIKFQAPTYEYVILPVVGGMVFKTIDVAAVSAVTVEGTPTISGTIISGGKNILQYGLIPASIGIPLGKTAAETGLTSPETVEIVLGSGYQLAVGVAAYKGYYPGTSPRVEALGQKIENYGTFARSKIGEMPVIKQAGEFKTTMQEFKTQFYNPTEVSYRMRYGQDSFGNPPTPSEKLDYQVGADIRGVNRALGEFKTSMQNKVSNVSDYLVRETPYLESLSEKMGDFIQRNKPAKTETYIDYEFGYRVTETVQGKKIIGSNIKKVNIIDYKNALGDMVKTLGVPQEKLELSVRKMTGENIFADITAKPTPKSLFERYEGMSFYDMPEEPMMMGKTKTTQLNFFGDVAAENLKYDVSKGFEKLGKNIESNILESQLNKMLGFKNELYNPPSYEKYGKIEIKTELRPFEKPVKPSKGFTYERTKMSFYDMPEKPYTDFYPSMKELGLPDEPMTSNIISYSEALGKLGGMKTSKSFGKMKMEVSPENLLVTEKPGIRTQQEPLAVEYFNKPQDVGLVVKGKSSTNRFYSGVEELGLPKNELQLGSTKPVKTKDLFALMDKPFGVAEEPEVSVRPAIEWKTAYQPSRYTLREIKMAEAGVFVGSSHWEGQFEKPTMSLISRQNLQAKGNMPEFKVNIANITGETNANINMSLLGTKTAIGSITSNIQDVTQGVRMGELQMNLSAMQLDLALETEQLQIELPEEELITREGTTIITPPVLFGATIEYGRKKKTTKGLITPGKKGFNVYVKTRHFFKGKKIGKGFYKKINVEPLSKESALGLLGTKLKMTAAATGKIVPVATGYVQEKRHGYEWGTIAHQFYEKGEGVYIQKKQYRIGTTGEKKEITMLGVKSNKIKGLKNTFNLSKSKMRLKL